MASNKKIIISVIIAVILVACAAAGVLIYKEKTGKLYSGEGIYYSQQNDGKYLQFNKDNTFSYVTGEDKNSQEISKGTWTKDENKVTLTYSESGNSYTFIETDDGYLYREDTVFKGKTSDEKLLNNVFVLEKEDGFREELWFESDGRMDKVQNGKIVAHGTYTRVDDILIVRYDDNPDKAERFLVLETGISRDIFCKEPVKEVTE